MENTLDFSDRLRLIDERLTAFRAVVAAAPDLDAQVPTCPDWTLFDLAQHIGQSRRRWAAVVAAGPAEAPPAGFLPENVPAAPREREVLVEWLAESSRLLLDALKAAGPDRGCWTWWGDGQSPQNSGVVARHQLQEISVHTYDAQLTVGAPAELPTDVALDGVGDFLYTCCSTTSAWPHEPAVVEYYSAEGHSWRVRLDADGALISPLTAADAGDGEPDVSARGTAAELVLFFYGRTSLDSVEIGGDRRVFERLFAWDPSA
ncbi:maleylpyruvate isomerase family mycothiol-dependent enzyme [Kitasatospora sp. NPDC093806]|uniref:maleylpyruvate isomerase family mycothiol-dependent enzyme n=1 Tax=Kitasatospora sp. NPDC093806 TaxID=3155075 RepID=UPI00342731F6